MNFTHKIQLFVVLLSGLETVQLTASSAQQITLQQNILSTIIKFNRIERMIQNPTVVSKVNFQSKTKRDSFMRSLKNTAKIETLNLDDHKDKIQTHIEETKKIAIAAHNQKPQISEREREQKITVSSAVSATGSSPRFLSETDHVYSTNQLEIQKKLSKTVTIFKFLQELNAQHPQEHFHNAHQNFSSRCSKKQCLFQGHEWNFPDARPYSCPERFTSGQLIHFCTTCHQAFHRNCIVNWRKQWGITENEGCPNPKCLNQDTKLLSYIISE